MNNKTNIFLLTLLSLVFISCGKNYCNSCASTKMTFNYKGSVEESTDLSKDIRSATLFIYDKNNNLVRTQPVSRTQMISPQGVYLDLDFNEEYTVVCWTNLTDNASANEHQNLEKATIALKEITGKEKLHYGVEVVTVDGTKAANQNVVVMNLYPSFISLNIKVVGPKTLPEIKIKGFKPIYGFTGKPLNEKESFTYSPKLVKEESEHTYSTHLSVFNPKYLLETSIELISQDHDPFNLDLNKFVKKKYPSLNLDTHKEITIDVLMEYNNLDDVEVTVNIPSWKDNDTSTTIS